jgi:hypothetical protein
VNGAAPRAGEAAVTRVVAAMAALAAEVPAVSAEPVAGGLRLSGPRLKVALVENVRLRALAAQAVRVRP